ncbi:MAG: hypothetical protein KY468_03350 [Armatimonadetes bacterium]|nr:hypothetical protein [Armatimonadota bacterium]
MPGLTASLIRYLLCGALLAAVLPVFAQEDEPPPASQGPLKSWYPRLSQLPYYEGSDETIFIAGVEYFNRKIQVSFFDGTPEAVRQELHALYSTEANQKQNDGRTHAYTLVEKGQLLPAVDAYNDHPAVQSARLIRFYNSGTSVTPSPIGSHAGDGGGGVEALRPGDLNRDQLWTVMDAVIALRAVVGLQTLSPFVQAQSDINGNHRTDVFDAVAILGLSLGKSLPPPYGYQ